MGLDFVKFAGTLTFVVNTGFDGGGGLGDLAGADHGGPALDGVSFAADRGGVGAAHDDQARGSILQKNSDDLAQGGGRHGDREPVEDRGVNGGVGIVDGDSSGGSGRLLFERGAKSFQDQRLGKDAVEAFDGRRRRGGHGEEARTGGGLAEMAGQLGSGEAGHAEIGEDAVGGLGAIGEEPEGLVAAGGLEDGPAIGLEQDGSDGEADRVVVDGEDVPRGWRAARIHGVFDFTRR